MRVIVHLNASATPVLHDEVSITYVEDGVYSVVILGKHVFRYPLGAFSMAEEIGD